VNRRGENTGEEEDPEEVIRTLRAEMGVRKRKNDALDLSIKDLEKTIKSQKIRMAKAEKDAETTDLQLFHGLHTWCQPAVVALTAIVLASYKYDISKAVNHDETGIDSMEWLISNALGWGLPAALLPMIYWNKLDPSVRVSVIGIMLLLAASFWLISFSWGG
tara:strand:+ start:361 stop:846 length:486 start_codon:yes stop_codon:yes gene_type:complete